MSSAKRKKGKPFSSKYIADDAAEWEPGSRRRVLRNRLGITSVRDMEEAELAGYIQAETSLLREFGPRHVFTVGDVVRINQLFLGGIYPWAGRYRTVNLTKGGFPFATAFAIPKAMETFGREILSVNTPCLPADLGFVSQRIACVHVEFLLIHPFREGNGRTARLLATLMAYQAGLPGIDFGFIGGRGNEFNRYVTAVQQGIEHNYKPMEGIVRRALERALQLAGGA